MNPPTDLLNELYQAPRDARTHELATRHAPILSFDEHEPFLPLAAGVTLFEADGTSPSMKRTIQLAPPGKPAASVALEYAIWWDWDIHHLYELEHAWVYLDAQGQVVRVEASWHGKYNEQDLNLEDGHPIILSEPGKHAFASQTGPFLKRAGEVRRVATRFVGAQAHVLINDMFRGQIRQRVYDDSLARSYLVQQAFEPAWAFSQVYRFRPESLVNWDALNAWIPKRVNAWLEYLDRSLAPDQLRAMHLAGCDGSPEGLAAALESGADGVVLPVISAPGGQAAAGHPEDRQRASLLEDVFRFLRSVPMSVIFELREESCIEPLASFLNEKKVFSWAPVTAAEPGWLVRLKTLAPQARVIVQLRQPSADPEAEAAACQAAGVLPLFGTPSPEWVERVHAAGMFALCGPVADPDEARALERLRVDRIWKEIEKP